MQSLGENRYLLITTGQHIKCTSPTVWITTIQYVHILQLCFTTTEHCLLKNVVTTTVLNLYKRLLTQMTSVNISDVSTIYISPMLSVYILQLPLMYTFCFHHRPNNTSNTSWISTITMHQWRLSRAFFAVLRLKRLGGLDKLIFVMIPTFNYLPWTVKTTVFSIFIIHNV